MTFFARSTDLFPDTLVERLFRHIQFEPNSGCWLWERCLDVGGYAKTTSPSGRAKRPFTWAVHRVLYGKLVGGLTTDRPLDHKCRTRCCVNPAHLEPVTFLENLERSPLWTANRTHCPQGHAYSEHARIVRRSRGETARSCKLCERRINAEYRSRETPAQKARRIAKRKARRSGPEYNAKVREHRAAKRSSAGAST